MFRNILVPVDLTDRNVKAIETARDLAASSGGSVTLLHVVEMIDLPIAELQDFYRRLEKEALRSLETQVAPLRAAGVEHSAFVDYGDRAVTIVARSQKQKHDVIVMTSHRVDPANPGLSWTTLSYKVAILAQCPILLVK